MNQLLKPELTMDYEKLTHNLGKLLQVQNVSEIYNLIGEGLHQIIPNGIIIVNQIDKEEKHTITHGIYGLEESTLYKYIHKLGINPIGRSYRLKPELLNLYKVSTLHKIPDGLARFSNKTFPSKVLNELEKLIGIKQIYTAGLKKNGKLFTIVHIFKLKSPGIQNIDLAQLLLNQSSLVLQNRLYQLELEEKEQALQQTIKEANSSYIIWNSLTDKLKYSPQFIQSLNYRPIELKNNIRQWENLVHPEDKNVTLKKIGHFIQQKIPFRTEYRIKNKAGNYKWFEATFKLYESNINNSDDILIIHTDIDDSKKAELALQKSKNRFQKLANVTSEGIIIHKQGICIDLNQAIINITGYTKNDLLGKDFKNILFCNEKLDLIDKLQPNQQVIICAINKNGNKSHFEVSNRKLDDNHEVFTIRNVSELKEKETELKNKNEKLEEAIHFKNQFLRVLSHDLKNPISSIQGLSELLNINHEKYPREKIGKLINSVYEESRNTSNMLESLLLWSQKDNGNFHVQFQTVNLSETIDEIFKLSKNQANRKSISLTNKIPGNTYIKADIQLLRVILRNLINNAIKFTYKSKNIYIDKTKQNGYSILNIRNEGVEMSQALIDNIIKMDRNKPLKGTDSEQGTGFGLGIVKDLIELHKSQLQVKSNSQLTSFSFSIEEVDV
jgi:PAS domain S-box-containing protein